MRPFFHKTFALACLFTMAWFSMPAKAKDTFHADKILIVKSSHSLQLIGQNRVLKSYSISLGGNPIGAKAQQGDEKTPEGKYRIDFKNPNSAYHLSLHISYPNSEDILQAKRLGVSPGGGIFIHGLPNAAPKFLGGLHQLYDWTKGCVGMSNEEIEEVYRATPVGTEVEILP